MITQLDSENADRDLTSQVTVLTDTPDANNPILCQGLILFGDGTKDLDGTGGNFELTITVGGQTIEPNPQIITFSTAVRTSVWTSVFPVPANAEVILKVKSPNGADTDVDITAYLYNAHTVGDLTTHSWHVSKAGNDGNGGHSFADAKLTVSAAVTAAANGDTIIIWPGDYDETVDLDTANKSIILEGTSRYKSRIIRTSNAQGLILEDKTVLKNLSISVINAGNAAQGVYGSGKSDIYIEDCDIFGSLDGAIITGGTKLTIINSNLASKYDAFNYGTMTRVLVINSILYTDGSYGASDSRAIVGSGKAKFKNCILVATRDDAEANCVWCSASTGQLVLDGCLLDASAGSSATGHVYGIRNDVGTVTVNRCSIITSTAGSGTPYDLYNGSGKIYISNSLYSTAYGTIIAGDRTPSLGD